jgi:hypothetical protein
MTHDIGPERLDPASESAPARNPYFVQSLERGLSVIRAFDADNPTMTLSEVARRTGVTRAAARRFLLTLLDLGYVRSDGRQFRLGPRVLDLGYAYLSGAGLPALAQAHLEALQPTWGTLPRSRCSMATTLSTSPGRRCGGSSISPSR